MGIVMLKKRKYLILLFVILMLSALTAGIYLFVRPSAKGSSSFQVNKYSETIDWCDTKVEGNILAINCKGLLKNVNSDGCFETQIVTNARELKDLTICENNDTLSYMNEVLAYKKLMPLNIELTYTKNGILGTYAFTKVTLSELNETQVQNIVNDDIANLVTKEITSSAIQNSVDFCPRPETLPTYVIDSDKQKYTEYFNKNIMEESEYKQRYLYTGDDSIIRMYFVCDSAQNLGYSQICNMKTVRGTNLLPSKVNKIAVSIDVNKGLNENETAILKDLSLIYDHLFINQVRNNLSNLSSFNRLIELINAERDVNEEILCSVYKIYKNIPQLKSETQALELKLQSEASGFKSSICNNSEINSEIDKTGMYIKKSISNINIYERCLNLVDYLK